MAIRPVFNIPALAAHLFSLKVAATAAKVREAFEASDVAAAHRRHARVVFYTAAAFSAAESAPPMQA